MPSEDAAGGLDDGAVRAALDELLAWEPMRRSPQLGAFLRYIVEARLEGDEANLKAYSIAVDVLGRGEDFDPQSDPIVRVQARRLRNLLSAFYESGEAQSAVRIALPVGRYVPQFIRVPGKAQPAPVRAGGAVRGSTWVVGLVAIAVLVAAIAFWPHLAERTGGPTDSGQPLPPLVLVEEFENLAFDERGTPLVAGLAVEMVTDLNQFPDIVARYGGARAALSPAEMALDMPVYLLSGVARRVAQGVQYGIVLTDGDTGATLANHDLAVPLVNGAPGMSIDDVARYFVMRLASPRSVLHAPVRAWFAANDTTALALYPCLAAYWLYREKPDADAGRVEGCAENLAATEPDARAMLASLLADRAWNEGAGTEEGREIMAEARALAQSARDEDPMRAMAWMALARVAFFSGELLAARDNFHSAYQLNPASADIIAGYAQVLGHIGNWQSAMRLSDEIRAAESDPPAWFHLTPALHALRMGDYAEAADHARLSLPAHRDMSLAILVAAGGQMRNGDLIDAYLPQLLAGQRFRRAGIMPTLRYLISDTELLRQFSMGIAGAGVPPDRMSRPF